MAFAITIIKQMEASVTETSICCIKKKQLIASIKFLRKIKKESLASLMAVPLLFIPLVTLWNIRTLFDLA